MKLVDPQGRHIHKLRLSLLDACNLRCRYCMPMNQKFLPHKDLMSQEEICSLASILVDLGFDEIRLTGGEPSLRFDFMDIVYGLSNLSLSKLAVTSNGVSLKKHLPQLIKTKCQNINFSLDSLEKNGFQKITAFKNFDRVWESIVLAKELGFNIKVNVVLMRGMNDHEIEDFIKFSGKYEIEVRFLELMRIGPAQDRFEEFFVSADEIMSELEKHSSLQPMERLVDSTSFNFKLDNGANIGIIASESKPFCDGCSRLRLMATGELRPCLMVNKGFSLKNKSILDIQKILSKTMSLKPTNRIYKVEQAMNQIGG